MVSKGRIFRDTGSEVACKPWKLGELLETAEVKGVEPCAFEAVVSNMEGKHRVVLKHYVLHGL
jgi:hypothetical protein